MTLESSVLLTETTEWADVSVEVEAEMMELMMGRAVSLVGLI